MVSGFSKINQTIVEKSHGWGCNMTTFLKGGEGRGLKHFKLKICL